MSAYRVTVTPADVGARVVLRRRLPDPDGGPPYGDVLGELVDWSDGRLVVRRRDGTVVTVDEAAVIAGHRVPPPPRLRGGVGRIGRWQTAAAAPDPVRAVSIAPDPIRVVEAVAARGWQALETAQFGGWLLRAAGGFTGRANSVLPLDDPDRPGSQAIEAVERWYADRELPARFQLPLPLAGALDAQLADRGYRAVDPAVVCTAQVTDVLGRLPESPRLPPVELSTTPSPAWLAGYRYRGQPLPPVAAAVLVNADRPLFALVRSETDVLTVARAAVNDGWVGVTALEVTEGARRRGLARHVLAAVLRAAANLGADRVYLQVRADNEPARALYDGLNFTTSHRYHYRLRP